MFYIKYHKKLYDVFQIEYPLNYKMFLGNDRSFTGMNGIIKNDAIVPKKNEHRERVLKNIGMIYKLPNG